MTIGSLNVLLVQYNTISVKGKNYWSVTLKYNLCHHVAKLGGLGGLGQGPTNFVTSWQCGDKSLKGAGRKFGGSCCHNATNMQKSYKIWPIRLSDGKSKLIKNDGGLAFCPSTTNIFFIPYSDDFTFYPKTNDILSPSAFHSTKLDYIIKSVLNRPLLICVNI